VRTSNTRFVQGPGSIIAVSAAALLVTLSGCKVGPNYVEPVIDSPTSWSEIPASTPADLRQWWTRLNEPTLDTLVQRASAGNLELRQAIAAVREARELRQIARSSLLPTIDASGGYSRNEGSSNVGRSAARQFTDGGSYDLFQAGFDATWELDFFGRVSRGVEAAEAEVAVAEYNAADVMVIVTAEVVRNYIDLRTTQRRLVLARGNVATQQDTLALAESRFRAGLTSELDVARAKANVETTRSQIPSFEASERRSMHALAVLLGRSPGVLIEELATFSPIPVVNDTLTTGVPSELLRRRPDLRASERSLAGQTARIGVATGDLFPRFLLGGSVGWNASKFASLYDASSVAYSVGPSVTWNVFDYGRIRANIRAQSARAEALLAQYERNVIGAFQEVEDALVSYSRERVRQEALSNAVAAGQRAVELSSELYKQGLTDFNAVLDAQRQLFLLEDSQAESQGEIARQYVAIYKALGGGWGGAGGSDSTSGPIRGTPIEGAPATPDTRPGTGSETPTQTPMRN